MDFKFAKPLEIRLERLERKELDVASATQSYDEIFQKISPFFEGLLEGSYARAFEHSARNDLAYTFHKESESVFAGFFPSSKTDTILLGVATPGPKSLDDLDSPLSYHSSLNNLVHHPRTGLFVTGRPNVPVVELYGDQRTQQALEAYFRPVLKRFDAQYTVQKGERENPELLPPEIIPKNHKFW